MKTRRGFSYPGAGVPATRSRKRGKLASALFSFFDLLSDDIVLLILVKLAASANCPADFISVLLACKRFNCLGLNPSVLSKASAETFAVHPTWFLAANRFFQRCADAGNAEAYYIMGMINFYCFHNHKYGAHLITKAADKSHAPALYSLSIIEFNGSGRGVNRVKDIAAGVSLCARAAYLGHVDALRELGHCLKEGYGVDKNVAEGEWFLNQANTREIANIGKIVPGLISGLRLNLPPIFYIPTNRFLAGPSSASARRFNFMPPNCHPANRFLVTWHSRRMPDLVFRNCSYAGCGRVETMMHEFQRCAACGTRNYCSRGCQARDWTMEHRMMCRPYLRIPVVNNGVGAAGI